MWPLTADPLSVSTWVKPPLKRGEEPAALIDGHHHRPSIDRARGLVAPGVVGKVCPGVVDPQYVRDGRWILRTGPVGRHQHRRAAIDRRTGMAPDAFTGKRRGEHRFDPRWCVDDVRCVPGRRQYRADADARQTPQARTALARRARGVVLGRVDHPVAEGHVVTHPLRRTLRERLARRPEHVRRIGDPEVGPDQHQKSQHPPEDPAVAKTSRISSRRAHCDQAPTLCTADKASSRSHMRMHLDGEITQLRGGHVDAGERAALLVPGGVPGGRRSAHPGRTTNLLRRAYRPRRPGSADPG